MLLGGWDGKVYLRFRSSLTSHHWVGVNMRPGDWPVGKVCTLRVGPDLYEH